jgi:hypothetical protein
MNITHVVIYLQVISKYEVAEIMNRLMYSLMTVLKGKDPNVGHCGTSDFTR